MYPHLQHVLTMRGQHMPAMFDLLLDPFEPEGAVAASERAVAGIEAPVCTGAGWYGYTYKMHLLGAANHFALLKGCKRLLLGGPAHLERPVRALRHEMLAWYDHWLKGLDTGVGARAASQILGDGGQRMAQRHRTGRCRKRAGQNSI